MLRIKNLLLTGVVTRIKNGLLSAVHQTVVSACDGLLLLLLRMR